MRKMISAFVLSLSFAVLSMCSVTASAGDLWLGFDSVNHVAVMPGLAPVDQINDEFKLAPGNDVIVQSGTLLDTDQTSNCPDCHNVSVASVSVDGVSLGMKRTYRSN